MSGRAAVIDTMIASHLFRGGSGTAVEPMRSALGNRTVQLSFMSVAEMRFGALKGGWGELRRRRLDHWLGSLTVVGPDDAIVRVYATLRFERERSGHPLGQKIHEADRWIAATALSRNLVLVSTDSVFNAVPGLRLIIP